MCAPKRRGANTMKLRTLFLALLILASAGCAAPVQEEEWTPWYEYRGYCRLQLNVQVDSKPSGAQVYLGEDLVGTTPCSLVLEGAPVITGQKQAIASPVGGNTRYLVRDSRYHGQTVYTLQVAKDGYEPLAHTVVLENLFPADALVHDKLYEKSVTLIFELKKDR